MATLRPGSNLGQMLVGVSVVGNNTQRLHGVVKSVGATTCDVLLDGGGGMASKVRYTGIKPAIESRVQIEDIDGDWSIQAPGGEATSARGQGFVVFGGNGVLGTGGTSYPLPHAPSHAVGGSDPLTPAAIGAATPAQVSASMAAHLAAADPHTQYLLSAGDSMTGALSSNPFTSGATGWQITLAGDEEARNLHIRSSLYAQAFVFDLISTQAGTQLIAKNASTLANAMTANPGTEPIEWVGGDDIQQVDLEPIYMAGVWGVDVTDSPGTSAQIFDDNDIINIKSEIAGAIYETWFSVSNFVSNGDGTQHYTCAYLYGAIGTSYGKGTGVTDFGASDGTEQSILKATVIGANGPYYDILTHTGTPWLSYGAENPGGIQVRTRLGHLTGITDGTFGTLSGYGLYSQNVFLTGAIKATSGVIGPFTVTETKMYMGAGEFRDATGATPFYVDHNGGFSLNDKLFFNPLYAGGYLKIDANEMQVTGAIRARGFFNYDNTTTNEISFGQLRNFVPGTTEYGETGQQGSFIRSFGTNHTLYGGQLHFTTDNQGTVASTGGPGGMIFQTWNGTAFKQNAVMVGSNRRWGFGTVDPALEWQWAPYTFRDTTTYPYWPGGEGNWGGRYMDGTVKYILPGGKVVSGCLVLGVVCNELPSNGFIMEFIGYGVTKTVTLGSNVITFTVLDTAGDGNVFLSVQRTTGSSAWHASLKVIWV